MTGPQPCGPSAASASRQTRSSGTPFASASARQSSYSGLQRTTSSPTGRDARRDGYPIPMTEMLAILPGVAYAARGSVVDPAHIGKVKAMIKRACQAQLNGEGFAIVEILSNCPVGWGMTAHESMEHLAEVEQFYPLGVLVDRSLPKPKPTAEKEA